MKTESFIVKSSLKSARLGAAHLYVTAFIVVALLGTADCSRATAPATDNTSSGHTATTLADGRVLVVTGSGKSSVVSSAAIYDPATQTWSATGSLNVPRAQATATLLANGKVLVVGGYGNDGILASAELFDPSSGQWTLTGSLNTARWLHTASLLPNGEVLVTGGNNGSGGLATSELYDPATGVWTVTGSTSTSHWMHTATVLAGGNVLIAGGYTGSGSVPPTEIYDAGTGQWRHTRGSWTMNNSRVQHTATLLTNGMVLVTGGVSYGSWGSLSSTELFDPATETWTFTGRLNTGRFNPAASLLANGQVMVAGGIGTDGVLSTVEIYDPASGVWTEAGTIASPEMNQTATLLAGGQVLVTGSFSDPASAAGAAQLYSPPGRPLATATVNFDNLSQTYDGAAKPVSVTTTPAGLAFNLTYNGSPVPPVNAGTYTVVATINDPRYQGGATNNLFISVSPINLNTTTRINGGFQFSFTNSPGVRFTVVATTNLAASAAWSTLGTATETSAGVYQFNDTEAAAYPQRFYRVIAL